MVAVGVIAFAAAVTGDNIGFAIGHLGGRALALRWLRFGAFNVVGAALWVGTWVSLGYLAGNHIGTIYGSITRYSYYALIAAVVLLAGYITRRVLRRRRPGRRRGAGHRSGRGTDPGQARGLYGRDRTAAHVTVVVMAPGARRPAVETSMPAEIAAGRRRFLGSAALAVGAVSGAQLALAASAKAQAGRATGSVLDVAPAGTAPTGTARSFGPAVSRHHRGAVAAAPPGAGLDRDYVAVIIDNYRWRLDPVAGDPRSAAIEKRLAAVPAIGVPAVTVDGAYDPFTPAGNGALYRAHFTGRYAHRTVPVGHNVPQEDPRGFARAVVEADHLEESG